MVNDLRAFLDKVRRETRDLIEVERPVRPAEFEATAILKQLEDRKQYPAVMFRNPLDVHGKPSRFPLLSNMYATRERCAVALGIDPATPNWETSLAFGRKSRSTIAPVVIDSDKAPVHQTVWQGVDADVGRLPIVRHFAMDMGPTLTMTHVMRAGGGFYNVSFAKTFYKKKPDEMVVSLHTRDMSRIVKEAERRGEPVPIVNILGHHPAFHLGSLARNPWGADDYATLGSFLGEPLRLTPSVTWGDKFMVPADAEILVEGEILPGEKDVCDPFGEVARLYQGQCIRPIFRVKAITHRPGAIMQDIFSGFRDSFPLGALVKEGVLDNALRPHVPNLHQIHSPDSCCGVYAVYVSLKNARDGQAQELGKRIFEAFNILQCVVVVDDPIDVFNEEHVLWAVYTYANFAKGVHTRGDWPGGRAVQHAGGSGPQAGFGATNWGSKLVIDATRPRDFAFGSRSDVPDEVMKSVRLEDFLPTHFGKWERSRVAEGVQ
ncbi:MAG: UbiD family decarboxylase [Betaproteobacteria bacterium]|nr:UbiD family decarboxylase [Betaproteobacteria bacterium]